MRTGERGWLSPRVRTHALAESLECRRLLAVQLIEDINTTPWTPYGPPHAPSQPISIGSVALFPHASSWSNVELWRTDGTAPGTFRIADFRPGPREPFSFNFVRAGDVAYFKVEIEPSAGAAADPLYQLWRSDGTPEGTVVLTDPNTVSGPSVTRLTPVGSHVFFTGDKAATGTEWWVTDGTQAGTRLVKDLNPGAAGSSVLVSGTTATRLLFQVREQPDLLFASDGTDAGTLAIGTVGAIQFGFLRVGGVAFFVDEQTRSLWRTDGTAGGTTKVADRVFADWNVRAAAAAGGAVFFTARNADDTAGGLFRYHPQSGVTAVTLESGQPVGSPLGLAAMGDTLYVRAAAPAPEPGLYRVSAGSSTASVVQGLPADSNPSELTLVGDTVFLRAAQTGIYKITAPDAPATLVEDFPIGQPVNSDVTWPHGLAAHNGQLLFVAYDPAAGWELHKSDGTPEGTGLLADASPATEASSPNHLTPFNGKVLFTATDGVHGEEPWVTDGTAEGTFMLADVKPGQSKSESALFTPVGPRAFFAARSGGDGAELWVTDGTVAGTRRVKTIRTPTGTGDPNALTHFTAAGPAGQEFLMFVADDGVNGQALWRSDGTEAGTLMVADIHPSTARDVFPVQELMALGDGSVVFRGDDGVRGKELWRSDGTPGGTRLIKNIVSEAGAIPGDSRPGAFSRAGGYVYFIAYHPTTSGELWRTDGTPEGTVLVADIVPGRGPSQIGGWSGAPFFIELRGHVYFQAAGPEGAGGELWRTDGTAAGTVLVKDILRGPRGSDPAEFRVAGDRLYFKTLTSSSRYDQVWSTDGTAEGTVPLLPTGMMRDVTDLAVVGGRFYFLGTLAGSVEMELYTTDGTAEGTFMVADLGRDAETGYLTSRPVGLADGSLVVPGSDGVYMYELFRYDNPWAPRVVGRHVFYNRSAFDGGDAAADARDDAAVATDKLPFLHGEPGGPQPSAFFTNVTSYTRGINGIMVDVANLPAGVTLTADDFDFGGANLPASISVRRGAGAGGSDRVTLVWDDYGLTPVPPSPRMAVANGWLHVTVKANDHTGLATPDRFSFGNLIGESGNSDTAAHVNALDVAAVKRGLTTGTVPITSRVDFNRDGLANALDLAAVKRNLTRTIPMPLATGAPMALTPGAPVTGALLAGDQDRDSENLVP